MRGECAPVPLSVNVHTSTVDEALDKSPILQLLIYCQRKLLLHYKKRPWSKYTYLYQSVWTRDCADTPHRVLYTLSRSKIFNIRWSFL